MKVLQKNVKFYSNAEFIKMYSTDKLHLFCKNGIEVDRMYLKNKGLSEFFKQNIIYLKLKFKLKN